MAKRFFWIVLLGCWSLSAAAGGNIMVFGDSLSAAYGLSPKQGWVALLEDRIRAQKFDYTVRNASISGETTSGGAARIDAALKTHQPNLVVLALGANDGLRGLPVDQMKKNLAAMIRKSQAAGARVLLAGMRIPPNYGRQYTQEFEQAFADLAREYKTAYVPFLLEGVAGQRSNFQDDNLHPTAAAQSIMLDTVWRGLRPLLVRAV